MATLVERAIGAARLEPATYEEVEADTGALGQAMIVVVVAAIASGIGASGGHGFRMVPGAIGALVGWFVWAFTVYLVGTRLLPQPETKADLGELLRTTGFAAAPGVVGVLGLLPIVGGIALLVAWLWQLAAMVIAVRQALDYTSTGHAIAVCVIGFIAQLLVVFLLLGVLFGSFAAIGAAFRP
jgi:Yip1 domain